MHDYLINWLQCPACRGELRWDVTARRDGRIETAEATCIAFSHSYPVQDGIAVFLTSELDREDLWQEVESGLQKHLRQHPEVEAQLTQGPLEELGPADQFFRALVLEERGQYRAAKAAEEMAKAGLYTAESNQCWERQVTYVLETLASTSEPVVDLASGRGYLVDRLAAATQAPIVASDFSPQVLRRNRRWLEDAGLYQQVSLLAFDARQTPFKDGAVPNLTTNLGLPNIRQPGSLLAELRRITAGRFLAISQFYPEQDGNAQLIREAGLDDLLYRRRAVALIQEAGFQVEVTNSCRALARPTPDGEILAGARIDGLPQVPAELEWCVLEMV
jgi:uncharacterized protein YbaR (Trm112 family)